MRKSTDLGRLVRLIHIHAMAGVSYDWEACQSATHHHRNIRMYIREIQHLAAAVFHVACEISTVTQTTPPHVHLDLHTATYSKQNSFDDYHSTFMASLQSVCQKADMEKLNSILTHINAALQDAAQKCFCPHDLPAANDGLVAFRKRWDLIQMTYWPSTSSLVHAHVALRLLTLREAVTYVSHHTLAWCDASDLGDTLLYYHGLTATVGGMLQEAHSVLRSLHVCVPHE
jgi:hypothetical protein